MILGLTVGIMLIKSLVLLGIGIKHKFDFDQKILFVLLLSQVGEFAFVILSLTNNLKLLTKEWYDLLLATTAITMVITPLLLVLNEKLILKYFGVKTKVESII